MKTREQSREELEAAIERAKQRADDARSDGEYEAYRQVIIWLESLLEEMKVTA